VLGQAISNITVSVGQVICVNLLQNIHKILIKGGSETVCLDPDPAIRNVLDPDSIPDPILDVYFSSI
jgi:hypothetical protein